MDIVEEYDNINYLMLTKNTDGDWTKKYQSRWVLSVSYTHLDVYKRQQLHNITLQKHDNR